MKFSIVDPEEIEEGITTDVYFLRTEEILRKKGINPWVVAEVTVSDIKNPPIGSIRGDWGVLAGTEDVAHLFEKKSVDIYAMEEGTIFYPNEPVLRIEGRYLDFARYETPLLGFLCHQSGIATKAARARLAAGDVPLISFGTRRQHPALALIIERCAYIGGMDGVSNVAAARHLGIRASGTMPHSLIICFSDQKKAWKAFDEVIDKSIPRICLCDTYCDEKTEAIMACETLENSLHAVRLDTPSSRRGNFRKVVEEVRWELDIRGFKDVGIFVSGGIDEQDIIELRDIVSGFGVGSSVANARAIDFALDIVEIEGKPCAKRGKRGGKKQIYRNWETMEDEIRIDDGKEGLLKPLIRDGKIVREFSLERARERVMKQLRVLNRSK
ncbi:MAG: nicotinate phosphoribosyltransferase [Candidatus Syntropharchaeia archaeon]